MKRRRKNFDRVAAELWATDNPGVCSVCGEWCGWIQGHHVLYQQWIRSAASTLGLDYERVRWDVRNRLWVGAGCHGAHHGGGRRIPMQVLHDHCPEVFDMAYELGLDWRLDNTYPTGRVEAA